MPVLEHGVMKRTVLPSSNMPQVHFHSISLKWPYMQLRLVLNQFSFLFLTQFYIFLRGVRGSRTHRNETADVWLFSPDAVRSCLSARSASQLRSVTLNAADRSARQHPKPSGPRLCFHCDQRARLPSGLGLRRAAGLSPPSHAVRET